MFVRIWVHVDTNAMYMLVYEVDIYRYLHVMARLICGEKKVYIHVFLMGKNYVIIERVET